MTELGVLWLLRSSAMTELGVMVTKAVCHD